MSEKVLTRRFGLENSRSIRVYESTGGYSALKKALGSMKPDEVIEIVKASKLRGRGGAGFPAGVKWGFVPKDSPKPKYFVVNADESEPGTFKDHELILNDPHMLIEGTIIGAYAIGSHRAFIYMRGEFKNRVALVEAAIAEARKAGYVGRKILGSKYDLELTVYLGAGAYICGEETGLLSSLEGWRGYPKIKPPFPAVSGLYGCPTVVNNVETLCCVPDIITRGPEWFAALGAEDDGGTKLYCVSGHVDRPGMYELPMGTNLKEIVYEHAGGIRGGRALKAVIPGGSSVPVLRADEIDIPMSFKGVMKAGSMLGSAGVIVMDETTDMVRAFKSVIDFYAHESCGQCTPCREGCHWLKQITDRIVAGRGKRSDLDRMVSLANNMVGRTICVLADAAQMPTVSFVTKFRSEFEAYIRSGGPVAAPRGAAAPDAAPAPV
jgi:NADH-quinone oxidoreductase subunit F